MDFSKPTKPFFRIGTWSQVFVILLLVLATSCNQLSMPRLSFEEEVQYRVPVSVTYVFDPQLTQASLDVQACDMDYNIPTGSIITQSFLEIGQERFASVIASPAAGQPTPVAGTSQVTIHLSLVHQGFESSDKFGQEDRYMADVDLQLQAMYLDQQGQPIAKTPLTYHDRVKMWAPELTSDSVSCATGQFDSEFEAASKQLAKDMVNALPQLFGQPPPPGTTAQAFPPLGSPPLMAPSQTFAPAPSLSFRTMLQDGNDNLILEGAEKLVLQIEITNKGRVPVGSALVDLSGTQAIIDAFSHVTSLPMTIDPLQPGETTTTEIRGVMPSHVESMRGELVVSVKTSEGASVGSHKILAAIQPGTTSAPIASTETKRAVPPRTPSQASPYYALLVGLTQYRDPWRQLAKNSSGPIQGLADTLKTTGVFSEDNIRTIQNTHATKTDIEEALLSWAKPRMSKESVLLVYFSGQAVFHQETGEVYLVPYEGSPHASTKRLISLRILQKVLGKLKGKVTLLFLDTPVTPLLRGKGQLGSNGKTPLKWGSGLLAKTPGSGGKVIQIRKRKGTPLTDPAQMLAGLHGRADRDRNNIITVGELLQELKGLAEIRPSVTPKSSLARIPLAE